MARLPYLNVEDLAPADRDLLARPINLFRLMVHSPGGARAFHGLGRYIRFESPLDARLREMAIIQIGWLTRVEYEFTHHVKIGRDFGVTTSDIRAIIDETAGRPTSLAPLERAVLRAAREMTHGLAASEQTFAELRQGLDERAVTDLVIVISFYNAVVRFLTTMQIDNEPEYAKLLSEFPFPESPA